MPGININHRDMIIQNLETLEANLPEIARATKDNKIWDAYFPYTIGGAIEMLNELTVCDRTEDATATSPVVEIANAFRADLKMLEDGARGFIKKIKAMPSDTFGDKSETIAQATLAMRHIEDARMKYGKVLQYHSNDGVSIFDKSK